MQVRNLPPEARSLAEDIFKAISEAYQRETAGARSAARAEPSYDPEDNPLSC